MLHRLIRRPDILPYALVAAAALALAAGCKGEQAGTDEATETEPQTDETAELETDEQAEGADEADTEADAEGDFIRVLAKHAPEKDDDPVTVEFGSFEVTSASFDPENLEGGEATIEIDLTSLDSGIADRNEHLLSADYLNTEEHPVATVTIADVEQVEGDRYKASAAVSVHGAQATWPIEFEVVDASDDAIRVRAEHDFDRMDFQVGQEETGEDADPVARELRLEVELTVSPS
jgi:polyisoprenoid-binding protein YceI